MSKKEEREGAEKPNAFHRKPSPKPPFSRKRTGHRNTVTRRKTASRRKKKEGDIIKWEQRSLMNSVDNLFTPAPKPPFRRKRKRHSLLRKRKSRQKRQKRRGSSEAEAAI
jgi:hypothetical protein